ncbi:sugar phosphate isomerase/epimerase family protein [Dactylosporangium sp. CS-033363]|uniref:sugar phosphate isomerase/epimerase family protein n=1 Tax=Dactylosporangium sp. CS-033363 TaxID=3239935 RepID=UPI003D8F72E8
MKPQPFRIHDQRVVKAFAEARRSHTADEPKLKFGWSNWGFGTEELGVSAERLAKNGVQYIELHGNLYSDDFGYRPDATLKTLGEHGITVSGICGMVTPDQEFAHNLPHVRARAVEYFRRQAQFTQAVGGSYLLFGAGSVGRPVAFDSYELERSASTMRHVADDFAKAGIRGAVEPIRPEETSVAHTFEQVLRLLDLVGHPSIAHVNGDTYHMLSGELHIGATLLDHGHRMLNLHLADTNRRALGHGLLDLDVVIMALYAIGYQRGDNYCSAEPLGAGGNPYAAMNLPPQTEKLDELVRVTAETFRSREEEVLGATDDELFALYQIDGD